MNAPSRSAGDDQDWIDVDDFNAPSKPTSSHPLADELEIVEAESTYFGKDFLSMAGARELKRRIESYWRAKGYEVRVTLQEGPFHAAVRSARQDVRSDMVDGLPQRKRH